MSMNWLEGIHPQMNGPDLMMAATVFTGRAR